jgi:hypothetical protein
VLLRYHDHVVSVGGPGVAEREHVVGLEHDVQRLATGESLVAVPVMRFRHRTIVTGMRHLRSEPPGSDHD